MLSTSQHAFLEARPRRLPLQGLGATLPRKSGSSRKTLRGTSVYFFKLSLDLGWGYDY